MKTSTLRPGLLVSLKSTVSGNVHYTRRDIVPERIKKDGTEEAKWETERVITDPVEHEAATKARQQARQAISKVCAVSAFGLLCPESKADELEAGIVEAKKIVDAFNETAKLTRVSVYAITGRIAPDDVEAVRAINSEVKELLDAMQEGVSNLNVKVIREAAAKARSVAAMLSMDAEVRVKVAIEAARKAASKIVKAGEAAAIEVDRQAIRTITEARTAFLDLGPVKDVSAPVEQVRVVDLSPEDKAYNAENEKRSKEIDARQAAYYAAGEDC